MVLRASQKPGIVAFFDRVDFSLYVFLLTFP